jgi:hypothetical protein
MKSNNSRGTYMFMLTFQIKSTCDERYLWSKMKSIYDGRYSILQKNPNGDFFQIATYPYCGELGLVYRPNLGG